MRIVISGAGEVGAHLAKLLSKESNEITVIDNEDQRLQALIRSADVEPIPGNPTNINVLKEAEADKADLFIAVYPYVAQEVNLMSALMAKQMGAKKVLARITNIDFFEESNLKLMDSLGIDYTFSPEKLAAEEICEQLKHTATSSTLEFSEGKLQVAVFKLNEDSDIIDMKLKEFVHKVTQEEGQDNHFRIIAISRNERTIIPGPDTKFQFGDIIYTISGKDSVAVISKHLGVRDMRIRKVMILGGGTIGLSLASLLSDHMDSIKVIDFDHERCIRAAEVLENNVQVVYGDGRNAFFLAEEGIKDYDAFVALTGSDEANILACVTAKKYGVPRAFAEVENIEYINLAEEMGVDTTINKKLISANKVFKYTLKGKANLVRSMMGTSAEMLEYEVTGDCKITRGELKEIEFPNGAVIGGYIRGKEAHIAVGSSHIQVGDRVAVFALPEAIKSVDKLFK